MHKSRTKTTNKAINICEKWNLREDVAEEADADTGVGSGE